MSQPVKSDEIEAYLYKLEREYEALINTRMASGLEHEIPRLIHKLRTMNDVIGRLTTKSQMLMREAEKARSEFNKLKKTKLHTANENEADEA